MGTRLALLVSSLLLLGGLSGACAEDEKRPPHEGDRQSGATGGSGGSGGSSSGVVSTDGGSGLTDASSDGGLCTDLVNTGILVDENALAGDFVGTGGALVDGTYNIVEARLYLGSGGTGTPGPTNRSYQGSIRLTGTTYESVLTTRTGGTGGTELRSRGTLVADGTSVATLALTCPASSQEQLTYTTTPSGLTIANAATRVAFVLTKSL